jgi:transcription initiation factor TFIIIB Brf1 subunit/transcription initiation factor TFIIB
MEASSCCGFGRVTSILKSWEIVCEGCGADISDKTEDKGNDTSVNAGSPSGITHSEKRTGVPCSLVRSLRYGLSTVIGRTKRYGKGSKIKNLGF